MAKRVNAYLESLPPSVHKFKLDASNCDANLTSELVTASNWLVAQDLHGATDAERNSYFNALERVSADQRVGAIRGTHTGQLHPKIRGGGTGIIGTFNLNNAAGVGVCESWLSKWSSLLNQVRVLNGILVFICGLKRLCEVLLGALCFCGIAGLLQRRDEGCAGFWF